MTDDSLQKSDNHYPK